MAFLARYWMRTLRKEVTSFGTFLRISPNSATILTFSFFASRTHGTHMDSTNAPLRCSTMREEHRKHRINPALRN
jgi:hypothetical protein